MVYLSNLVNSLRQNPTITFESDFHPVALKVSKSVSIKHLEIFDPRQCNAEQNVYVVCQNRDNMDLGNLKFDEGSKEGDDVHIGYHLAKISGGMYMLEHCWQEGKVVGREFPVKAGQRARPCLGDFPLHHFNIFETTDNCMFIIRRL